MILGTTNEGADLALDLDRLVGSHLGIVANAGGGKSGLIRKLLEQTHGHIQHIVLDIEDEAYTLRQRYDYVIAGGDGADVPATVANAAGLATAALRNGFSLICQLNDLGGVGASSFVDAFIHGLMSAPRDLWHPVLIVIDETQRFDPESIRMLTERGRKRGFTAVLASQRLPKIDANIRGDLNNWIMGRVGQSLDRRIMADQLGFAPSDKRLAALETRWFWAIGPALSAEPVLFHAGDVETTMVKPGQAKVQTPPAPDALREILAALAVAPEHTPKVVPDAGEVAEMDPEWLDAAIKGHPEFAAMREDRDQAICERDEAVRDLRLATSELRQTGDALEQLTQLSSQMIAVLKKVPDVHGGLLELPPGGAPNEATPAMLPNVGGDHVDRSAERAHHNHSIPKQGTAARRTQAGSGDGSPASRRGPNGGLNAAARKMLDMLERIAPARVTWTSLAGMVGNKARGGNFNAARKAMRESGLIVEDGDTVRSTKPPSEMLSREQARQLWKSVLSNPAPRMIDALTVKPMSRVDLGEFMAIAPRGGNFNNGVAQLIRNGVAVDQAGVLHLARPLPGECA